MTEATDIHGFPSALVARVNELEDSLEDAEKRYNVASDFIKEETRQVEEHR